MTRPRHLEPPATSFDAASHRRLLEQFLVEDFGADDLTTIATVGSNRQAEARFVAKAPFVLAGLDVALEVFRMLDQNVAVASPWRDGDTSKPGDALARLRGRARALLSGERVALNLLQHLSGIATLTRKYVDAVSGTAARILDTRKTTPGLRVFEKYAVRVGGGHNHRSSLSDAILIKENHIRMTSGVRPAIAAARARQASARFVEVEVTTLDELREAVEGSPDVILLDNMSPGSVREAVKEVRTRGGRVMLEASGGITLENVRQYAEAGVDWISVGALTHSAPAVDISLEIEPLKN